MTAWAGAAQLVENRVSDRVVDRSISAFIDANGLNKLVWLYKKILHCSGGSLVVSPKVRTLFL